MKHELRKIGNGMWTKKIGRWRILMKAYEVDKNMALDDNGTDTDS